MFALPDDWVWDFWLADDGRQYHLFFLHAPKSLGDPDARHYHASIGHAVSTDLATWTRLDDALGHGRPGDFDELARRFLEPEAAAWWPKLRTLRYTCRPHLLPQLGVGHAVSAAAAARLREALSRARSEVGLVVDS